MLYCYIVKSKKGFTLMELTVVILITGIIAGMVFANMRVGGQRVDLNSDVEKLAGVIKRAQAMSLSGERVGGVRPAGGYGVHIIEDVSEDAYTLFANENDYQYGTGDTDIQTFSFTNGVEASSFEHSTIIFVPPSGTVYVYKEGGDYNGKLEEDTGDKVSQITLTQTKENLNNWIRINAQGEIDATKVE